MFNRIGTISRSLISTIRNPEFGLQYRVFGIGLVLVLLFYFSAPFWAYASDTRVVDGDTIVVGDEHIRVHKLDAPEIRNAECSTEKALGLQAKAFVEGYLYDAEITITRTGKKTWGRSEADVYVDGVSLTDTVIAHGYGVRWSGDKHDWCN